MIIIIELHQEAGDEGWFGQYQVENCFCGIAGRIGDPWSYFGDGIT